MSRQSALRRQAGALLCLLALLVTPASWSASDGNRAAAGQAWLATVVYVVDGDSVWVRAATGGGRVRLRLDGIDAPEICQIGGRQARQALQALVLGQRVQVSVWARDRFGRAIVRLVRATDDADVAAHMVALGWAWADRFHDRPGRYGPQEAEARRAARGVFASGQAEQPADFRRRHGPC